MALAADAMRMSALAERKKEARKAYSSAASQMMSPNCGRGRASNRAQTFRRSRNPGERQRHPISSFAGAPPAGRSSASSSSHAIGRGAGGSALSRWYPTVAYHAAAMSRRGI
eukprot:1433332-Prymnesium_polylepis.1